MSVTSECPSLDSIGLDFDSTDFDLDLLDDIELLGDVIGKDVDGKYFPLEIIAQA